MRLSNKQMEVKSIFGNVGGYMSGPTSNGMTQDTSDRESAQIRRYHLVICLPRCHGNTIATSHWLNLWERCRLNRYKVAGRRSSVRLYILFMWPYFCYMLKKRIKEPVLLLLGNQFLSFTFGIRSLWTNRSRPTHPYCTCTQQNPVNTSTIIQKLPTTQPLSPVKPIRYPYLSHPDRHG